MNNVFELSYSSLLIELVKDNRGLLTKVVTATVSASVLVFSLKKLHEIGFFSVKGKSSPQWKKVGRVDKLFLYPLKGAKGLEKNVSYFGSMGMQSDEGFHDRSFVLVDEKK